MIGWVRCLLLVPVALVLLAVGGSVSHVVGGGALAVAPWLPLVAWLGLEAGLVEGAAASAALGLLADASAGGPYGLLTFLAVAAFLGVRLGAPAVDARRPLAFAALTGVATLAVGLGAVVLTRYVSPPESAPRWGLLGRVLLEALLTAAVAPAVRLLLVRLVGTARREEQPELLR